MTNQSVLFHIDIDFIAVKYSIEVTLWLYFRPLFTRTLSTDFLHLQYIHDHLLKSKIKIRNIKKHLTFKNKRMGGASTKEQNFHLQVTKLFKEAKNGNIRHQQTT